MNYRVAQREDIPLLIETRKTQLIHEGIEPSINIDQELERFFQECFDNNTIYQIIGFDNNQLIATGAVCFYDYPPTYTNKSGKISYITNMYTHPHYRNKGFATKILSLLEKEVKNRNIEIMRLGASELGKPVYLKYGFVEDDVWMSKKL